MCKFNERVEQIEWFKNFGIINETTISNYNDGVYKGNLFEFKTSIADINKVLAQALNYLSILRAVGKFVPMYIHLIDVNTETDYIFNANDFAEFINVIPQKSSSVAKAISSNTISPSVIKYTTEEGREAIFKYLEKEEYFKITIDANCVTNWAALFYSLSPSSTKKDFLDGELTSPKILSKYILPYKGNYKEEFKSIIDTLNPKVLQRQIGAFYTPSPYCELTKKAVEDAVKRAMANGKYDDYVIIDRCAGTGNLEAGFTDELLKHTILSTYELMEWHTLNARLGTKVLRILPNREDVYGTTIESANALSKEYIENEEIKEFIDNERCAVILLENPPYADTTSNSKHSRETKKIESFVAEEMKKKGLGKMTNEICHQFIWSGCEYYKPFAYILYAPIKYYSINGLMSNYYYDSDNAFIFNRKHFHASEESISCISWYKTEEDGVKKPNGYIRLIAKDIVDDAIQNCGELVVKASTITVNEGYKKTSLIGEKKPLDFASKLDGKLITIDDPQFRGAKERMMDGYVGSITTAAKTFDAMNSNLLARPQFNGNDKPLYKDNAKENIPYFVASLYERFGADKWYKKGIFSRGGGKVNENGIPLFMSDETFLFKCFVWAICSTTTRGLSTNGIKNELCFDTDTWASSEYNKIVSYIDGCDTFKKLHDKFIAILDYCRRKENFDSSKKYNLAQINKELNTYTTSINEIGESIKVYDDTMLNSQICEINRMLTEAYKELISDLFKYELVM